MKKFYAGMQKNFSVAKVETYTKTSITKAERHNERKNKSYSNMNVNLEQTPNNVHYKKCNSTYNERLKELIDNEQVSLEVINQISHSKKWKSEQLLDNQGNPVYDEKGKANLIKSYSLLQDRFYQYMSDCGFRNFIRGVKGSNQEHLDNLQFKIKKDTEKIESITSQVEEKQSTFDNIMKFDKQIKGVSNLGKQKITFML